MAGESLAVKRNDSPDALSGRDKAILDDFTSGVSRKLLAEKYSLTPARIGQIINQPASIAYLLQRGGNIKAQLFAKVGAEILSRTEWGGVRLSDLLAIWKAAMPQEMTLKGDQSEIEAAAERLAEQTGIPKDRAVVDIRERLKRTG